MSIRPSGQNVESYDSLYCIRVLNKTKAIMNDCSHPLYNKYNFYHLVKD